MIPKAELYALRGEWSPSDEVIEKDYVLGWLLAGIAADPVLLDQWVFKSPIRPSPQQHSRRRPLR